MSVQQQAIEWLGASTLSESLKAEAIALVPTIPTNPARGLVSGSQCRVDCTTHERRAGGVVMPRWQPGEE
jgi:hypothetical protein